jgi:Flp pilus assembly protein TadD
LGIRRTLPAVGLALLGGGALLGASGAAAKVHYVKPDPNAMPPTFVKDLHYGDVLFYYFQDDYFDSITRLLAARQLGRLEHHHDEAELLLGGLYLSLGQHLEAGKIFDALLKSNAPESVRNKAWYYLGKAWYQRGYLEDAERALKKVSGKWSPRLDAERHMLLAQVYMLQGRYDDAIAVLNDWHGPPDWTAYAQFNLGVALVRQGRIDEAKRFLDAVGLMQTSHPELLALRDKANVAQGFALLQANRPADAKPILQRVRLEGPYSTRALLGVGWADAQLGEYKRALVPWLELHQRNLLDAAVQESFLAVPYAYGKLGASGEAAEHYASAINSFDAETANIDQSVQEIRAGRFLDRILAEEGTTGTGWFWQIKNLPNAPESRYLYEVLANHDFQEGLKNYRDLKFMQRNLENWHDSVSAFDDMIATRERAYAERIPRADAMIAKTDIDAMQRKRVDFESRLNEIEQSGDLVALGTANEQETWARLKRIESFLAASPDDPNLADMRDKERLMKGVIYWRLSQSFRARIWNERRSVKDLEAALKETQKQAVLVTLARKNAPTNTGEFAKRVADVRTRLADMEERLAATADKQAHYLENIAVAELENQKQRIATYQVQARFAVASIYDRAANPEPAEPAKPKDSEAEPDAGPELAPQEPKP